MDDELKPIQFNMSLMRRWDISRGGMTFWVWGEKKKKKRKWYGTRTQNKEFDSWGCWPIGLHRLNISPYSLDHFYIFFWQNFASFFDQISTYPIRVVSPKTKCLGQSFIVWDKYSYESRITSIITFIFPSIYLFLKKNPDGLWAIVQARPQPTSDEHQIITAITTIKIAIILIINIIFICFSLFSYLFSHFITVGKLFFYFWQICFPSSPLSNFMLNIVIITSCDDEYGG